MIENTHNCAPKIWEKLSEKQKEIHNNFCDQMGGYFDQWQWKHPDMPSKHLEHDWFTTMKHNLAIYAAWSYGKKTKNTYEEV